MFFEDSDGRLEMLQKIGLFLAWTIGAFIVLAIVAAINTTFAALLCGIGLVVTGISIFHPLKTLGIRGRWTASIGFVVFLITMALIGGMLASEDQNRLEALRDNDPAAYLSEIHDRDPELWFSELQELDPEQYQVETQRREQERAAQLAANQAEIDELVDYVRTVPASNVDENIRVYTQLVDLDPTNGHFSERLDHYLSVAREQRNRDRNPEQYVDMESFSWHRDGFDTVMVASFQIRNRLDRDIVDVEVTCDLYAPSGTRIDTQRATIYERFPANSTRWIRDFNMGFAHSQATQARCSVRGVRLS